MSIRLDHWTDDTEYRCDGCDKEITEVTRIEGYLLIAYLCSDCVKELTKALIVSTSESGGNGPLRDVSTS
jgi:DNA-directed RNA polymerase subunit RPC12/RpoP